MKFRGAVRAGNALREHAAQLRIAAQITGMRHDQDLPTEMSELELQAPDPQRLDGLFELLEFGTARRERWHAALQAIAS